MPSLAGATSLQAEARRLETCGLMRALNTEQMTFLIRRILPADLNHMHSLLVPFLQRAVL